MRKTAAASVNERSAAFLAGPTLHTWPYAHVCMSILEPAPMRWRSWSHAFVRGAVLAAQEIDVNLTRRNRPDRAHTSALPLAQSSTRATTKAWRAAKGPGPGPGAQGKDPGPAENMHTFGHRAHPADVRTRHGLDVCLSLPLRCGQCVTDFMTLTCLSPPPR